MHFLGEFRGRCALFRRRLRGNGAGSGGSESVGAGAVDVVGTGQKFGVRPAAGLRFSDHGDGFEFHRQNEFSLEFALGFVEVGVGLDDDHDGLAGDDTACARGSRLGESLSGIGIGARPCAPRSG